jgi:hypothetical protein
MDLITLSTALIAIILSIDKLVTIFQIRLSAYRVWQYKRERKRITVWNDFANSRAKEFEAFTKAKISKETHINYIMKDFYKAYINKL